MSKLQNEQKQEIIQYGSGMFGRKYWRALDSIKEDVSRV